MKDMLRKEILVGVIAAIIMTIFFEPIIRWLWEIITYLGLRTYSGFIDSIYRSAALGHRNHVDALIFFLILGLGTTIPIILRIGQKNLMSRLIQILSPKFEKVVDVVLFSGLIITASFLIINTFADLQLTTSFEQRLTVLAPALSEQEYKQIKAEWASMEGRDDFEAINLQMENLAKERNLELPKLLLP